MSVVAQVPLVRHDCEQWLATTAGGGLANTMVFEALYNKIFETLGATHIAFFRSCANVKPLFAR